MTDTPGWASPSSPEPPREAAGPSAAPSSAAPQDTAVPQDTPPAPPVQGWGAPGPYGGGAYGGGASGGGAYGGAAYGGQQGPQAGWGQQPGWGVPLSPKPGVIPLRPLGVGEILDGAMSTVRKHWRTTLGLSLCLATLQQTAGALAQWWAYDHPGDLTGLAVAAVPYLLSIVFGIVATGMLTMVVSKAILGEKADLGAAWTAARPQLGRLTGLTFLTFLIMFGVILLSFVPMIAVAIGSDDPSPELFVLCFFPVLAGLVVDVWLYISLSLAAPALMLEKQGVLTAMSRSRRLVKGSWWRQFGINLLSSILVGIVAGTISTPFTLLAFAVTGEDMFRVGDGAGPVGLPPLALLITAVGGTIAATLTIPVLASIRVLLYVDQRIRREALDIELARAAGLPEYGGTGWAGPGWGSVPSQGGPQGI
ncbi:hypothetical protein GCM10010193_20160 [Kitasatospora atroaurantiaca]|uniref:DUF7847 domain-containing protein n=1 Tax=Kitasatospora atroaurantiaca TaxID=285545 RepID=A0A561EPR3_9ACTN|nr:hypothetical protein [Kitasatospora atroaurantiaca]TWE17603.1 hypothetical protein FB465_2638 [Kitasatospora atroaurantiaca]